MLGCACGGHYKSMVLLRLTQHSLSFLTRSSLALRSGLIGYSFNEALIILKKNKAFIELHFFP